MGPAGGTFDGGPGDDFIAERFSFGTFSGGEMPEDINEMTKLSVTALRADDAGYTLETSAWNGDYRMQANVVDLRVV